jgi:hypothetical protein
MAPVTPPFADVLNSYMRNVVRELYPDTAVHEGLEKAIRSCVVELQQENKSESEIYELLAEMNPAFALVLSLELYCLRTDAFLWNMGVGTSTFRICFVRAQKSCSGFFRQSQQLVLVVGGSTRHNKKGRDGRFTKRATKNNPHTIAYLEKTWGV